METKVNHKIIKKALEGKHIHVEAFGQKYDTIITIDKYRQNGRTAIELITADEYEPFCTLTCNLDHVPLNDREVIVKTWSENEEVAACALASGLFRDTGKRALTGFVLAQIWEVL